MKPTEDLLDRMHQNLIMMGVNIDKADIEIRFLKPGDERLKLIQWALTMLAVSVKVEEKDVMDAVISFGLCSPSQSQIILGNCSLGENLKFWERLFNLVNSFKRTEQDLAEAFYNSCKFWLKFSTSPEMKVILQPKKKEEQQPSKSNLNPTTINREELVKERLFELQELNRLEQEKEKLKTSESSGILSETDPKNMVEEGENLQVNLSHYQQELKYWMPWVSENRQQPLLSSEMSHLIPDINSQLENLLLFCQNAQKVVSSVKTIKSTKLEEVNTENSLLTNLTA